MGAGFEPARLLRLAAFEAAALGRAMRPHHALTVLAGPCNPDLSTWSLQTVSKRRERDSNSRGCYTNCLSKAAP